MFVRFFVLATQSSLEGSCSFFNKWRQGKFSRAFTLVYFLNLFMWPSFVDTFGREVTIAVVFPSVPGL